MYYCVGRVAVQVRLRLMPDVQAAYLMLRFCLGVRVIFLLRALGGAMIGGDDAPGAKHNSFLRESLDVLLTDPTKPPSRRLELAEAGHPMRVYAQARLRAKDGGLGLTCACLVHAAAHVAGVVSCLVHETPLTLDDGKGATALRDGGAGAHRGRAHAPAYERPRGSM